jgi:hypothetical protein
MSDNILFDNIIITDSLIVAEQYAADSFDIKRFRLDKQAVSTISCICPFLQNSTIAGCEFDHYGEPSAFYLLHQQEIFPSRSDKYLGHYCQSTAKLNIADDNWA